MEIRMSSPRSNVVSEFNILLVGEVGHGKSLFVNSFANYLIYRKLEDAKSFGVKVILPYVYRCDQPNGCVIIGQDVGTQQLTSVTQQCRSYVFNFKNYRLRIIDSPGLTSAEGGSGQDSLDDIVDYIRNFEIHLIGIVLKSTDTFLSNELKQHLKLILQNFDKSASDNIVILYTYGDSCGFSPVESKIALKALFSEFRQSWPSFNIDLDDPRRVYCFENRGFKFLMERPVNGPGQSLNNMAWETSWNECSRLLGYFIGHNSDITVHNVDTTYLLHQMKRLVNILSAIEAREALVALNDNLKLTASRDDANYVIVCDSKECVSNKVADLGGGLVIPYKQLCCRNCNGWFIRFCSKFSRGRCTVCQCSTGLHQRFFKAHWTQVMNDPQHHVDIRLNEINRSLSHIKLQPMSSDVKQQMADVKSNFIKYINDNSMICSGVVDSNPADGLSSMTLVDIVGLKDGFYQSVPFGLQIQSLLELKKRNPDIRRDVNIKFDPQISPFNRLR